MIGQFVAVLRDSFREAASTWVLQVMLGLSGLLVLMVASASFHLVTLDAALANALGTLNWAARQNPAAGQPQFVVENLSASAPDEPWRSDYGFDIVVRCATPDGLKKARESGLPVDRGGIRQILHKELFYLDKIRVAEAPAAGPDPAEARFRVTTTGTKTPDRLAWPHEPTVFFALDLPFSTASLRSNLYRVEKQLVNDFGAWVALLVGVVITAGFIPNMLQKGMLDLYISKPIGRSRLLVYKYIGGLTFVALLVGATAAGVWLVLGLRTGVWAPGLLLVAPVLVAYFAVLYAVSTAVAVLTRSGLLAILATALAWAVCWGGGVLHEQVAAADRAEAKVKEELGKMRGGAAADGDDLPPEFGRVMTVAGWVRTVDAVLRPVMPRTYDLDAWGVHLIADGLLTDAEKQQRGLDHPPPNWALTAASCVGWIAVLLFLACWRFTTRDG